MWDRCLRPDEWKFARTEVLGKQQLFRTFVQAICGFLLGFRRGDSVISKTRAIGIFVSGITSGIPDVSASN